MSSQIYQNHPTQVKPAINHLAKLHLRASYTYLYLGFYFNHDDVTLEGVGHFLLRAGREVGRCQVSVEDAKPACGCVFQNVQKLSQDEWGKAQDIMELTLALEKNLNQALLHLQALHSACRAPQLCDFL